MQCTKQWAHRIEVFRLEMLNNIILQQQITSKCKLFDDKLILGKKAMTPDLPFEKSNRIRTIVSVGVSDYIETFYILYRHK